MRKKKSRYKNLTIKKRQMDLRKFLSCTLNANSRFQMKKKKRNISINKNKVKKRT